VLDRYRAPIMSGGWPDTAQAIVIHEWGQELLPEEVPLPDQLEPGAAMVRIECCTLCGSDVHTWEGLMASRGGVELPIVMGHEMCGEIVAIEEGSSDALGNKLEIGDRIVWSEASCGHCHECSSMGEPVLCTKRRWNLRQRADHFPYVIGGLTDYCYVPPGAPRLRVSDAIESRWASAATCALKTVVRAFRRMGGIGAGKSVIIQGTGALGLFATAMASVEGAGNIICIGGPSGRLAVAERFGAAHTIDVSNMTGPADRVAAVMQWTGGRGADAVFDFAGAPTVMAEGIEMAAKRGRFAIVGTIMPSSTPVQAQLVMQRELTVLGSTSGAVGELHAGLTFLERYADRFDWNLLFSEAVPLDHVMLAISAMRNYETVKAVVRPSMVAMSGEG